MLLLLRFALLQLAYDFIIYLYSFFYNLFKVSTTIHFFVRFRFGFRAFGFGARFATFWPKFMARQLPPPPPARSERLQGVCGMREGGRCTVLEPLGCSRASCCRLFRVWVTIAIWLWFVAPPHAVPKAEHRRRRRRRQEAEVMFQVKIRQETKVEKARAKKRVKIMSKFELVALGRRKSAGKQTMQSHKLIFLSAAAAAAASLFTFAERWICHTQWSARINLETDLGSRRWSAMHMHNFPFVASQRLFCYPRQVKRHTVYFNYIFKLFI